MSAVYGGVWRWPPQECLHDPQRRHRGANVRDPAGGLLHRIPEHCRDCGVTFGPPPPDPTTDEEGPR